jgi:protein-L-isoaspartate(D-aspartate) O-methyltransferase
MTRTRSAQKCLAILLASVCPWLSAPAAVAKDGADYPALRNRMVDTEIVSAGVKDPRVIKSMRDTPRHEFVASAARPNAYHDMALAIGQGQTISPPFVVAYMTEQLLPQPSDKVLEIGTGSGYQAAILSPLVKDVYTIEIVKPLGERAARTLKRLKYTNVHPRVGDGYQGWAEYAPFDKIIVTCSPEQVPPKLVEQLREGGRMIVPVGERYRQTLYLFQKIDGKLKRVALLPTLFVPMTGKAEDGRQVRPDPLHPTINNGSFEDVSTDDPSATAEQPAGTPPASRKPSDADKPLAADKPSTDEKATESEATPVGWHYQRQLKLVEAKDAPQGSRYVTFTNSEPGRPAQALQGLAVDGRKVSELNVSLWVKVQNVRQGENNEQLPALVITFYDENRAEAGYTFVGPWRDTFSWQKVVDKLHVPPKAREAIVRIGLGGGVGEASFDEIHISEK